MKRLRKTVVTALLATTFLSSIEYSKAQSAAPSTLLNGDVTQFALSPDGKRIAFARRTALGSRIWVSNFDGTNARIVSQVTREARHYDDFAPAWRGDDALIAFSSNRGGNFDLFAVRPDGSGARQITKTKVDERAPQWSPRPFGIFRPSDIASRTIVGRSQKNVAPSDLKLLQSLAHSDFNWNEYKDKFNVRPLARYYKLLCVVGKDASQQIVTLRDNGSLRQTLVSGMSGAHFAPVWERSAQTIAFARRTTQGTAIYQADYPDTTDLNEGDKQPRLGVDLEQWRKSIRRLLTVPTRTAALSWTRNGQYLAVASGKTLRLLPRADSKLREIRLTTSSPTQNLAWMNDGKTALVAMPKNGRTRLNRVLVSSPLLDIENLGDWSELSSRDWPLLAKNGFVAAGETSPQMYQVYENTDYENLPIFVTSDSLLHLNHLMFDYLLRGVETDELMPTAIALVEHHLKAAKSQRTKAATAIAKAALRNEAFFAVAARLALGEVQSGAKPAAVSDDDALGQDRAAMRARTQRAQNALLAKWTSDLRATLRDVSPDANQLANQELALIRKHAGLESSPIFGGKLNLGDANTALQDERIDYSDLQPRGHYTRSEVLRRYFLMTHWLSGAPFRRNEAGARRVLLMMQANDATSKARHAKIVRVLETFVGGADDDDFTAYDRIAREVWGNVAPNIEDDAKMAQFVEKINALPLPRIAPSRGAAFRFLPQPYTADAEAMQNLTYDGTPPDVGTRETPRYFALGLDVMGVLGSDRARQILDNTQFQGTFFNFGLKETQYENYDAQFRDERQKFAAFSTNDWNKNLYTRTLYAILPLLQAPSSTRYAFTQNAAWTDKSLNAALGAWTELKHDTMAKQPVAPEAGGEGGLSEAPLWDQPRGFVEPSPQVIARLTELAREEKQVLASIGYLSPDRKQRLETYIALLQMLAGLEKKQNANVPLSAQEVEQLRFYGAFLEHLTIVTAEGEGGSMEGPDMAIVADVASAFSTRLQKLLALEEGVGHALPIYVAVERNGHREIARGAVFTYYEFTQPAENRLTDEKWRDLLRDNPPKLPSWTGSFISRTKSDAE